MSSHLAHYLPFLLIIFFVCPTITVFLMSFTSTIHYVVLLISNKNLPLKKDKPCSMATCSCRSAKMLCTSYCKCKVGEQCANDNVKHIDQCDNSEQDYDKEWDSVTED